MYNSIITEYKNREKEYHIFYSKITLRKGLYVTNFDEGFFKLVGAKIYVAFTEYLYPEDVEPFLRAVDALGEGEQHLLFRMMCDPEGDVDRYRYFYAILKKNTVIMDGEETIDVELYEIMTIPERYKLYRGLVEKYREFMSMFPYMFMEYDYETDELKLYEYSARQNMPVFSGKLDALKIAVDASDNVEERQKLEFETFYSVLTRGQDHAKVQLDSACFLNNVPQMRLEIKTGVIYDEGVRCKLVGIASIVSEEPTKKCYYQSESAYDPGTGLFNKRAINEYAIEKIQNKTKGLCIAIIDLDDFKNINDSFGHMTGDEVLSKVAEIIKGVVKVRGAVGRFGGDEFMIVLEGLMTQMDLRRILATISANVRFAFSNPDGPKVTLSIGASRYPQHGESYEELFQKADKCVYIAKAKGKNRFIMYEEEKHGAIVVEDGKRINIGLKSTYSDDKKNDIVSELTMQLYTEGEKCLVSVMEQMQSYFDIDGIAVYSGDELTRKCSVGKYINPIDSLNGIKNPDFQEMFDEQNFYNESKFERLKKKNPGILELYKKQENGKFILCQAMKDGIPVAVISYDFFNRTPKHGTTDVGLMKIVGRMMAEVVARGLERD